MGALPHQTRFPDFEYLCSVKKGTGHLTSKENTDREFLQMAITACIMDSQEVKKAENRQEYMAGADQPKKTLLAWHTCRLSKEKGF